MSKTTASSETKTVKAVAFDSPRAAARSFPTVGAFATASFPAVPVIQAVWGRVDRADGENLNLTNEGGGNFLHRASGRRFRQISAEGQPLIVTLIADEQPQVQAMEVEEPVQNLPDEIADLPVAAVVEEHEEQDEEEEPATTLSEEILANWAQLVGNNARLLPKTPAQRNLACWNWALTALEDDGVNPTDVFTFLDTQSIEARGRIAAHFNEQQMARLTELSTTIRDRHISSVSIRRGMPLNQRDTARQITQETGRMIIESQGFEIVPANQTDYTIVLQYRVDGGISWEHWWIEARGTVVETFPGHDEVQALNQQQHANDARWSTIRYPVRELKAAHVAFIQQGMQEQL
jgi:hypothetical protein